MEDTERSQMKELIQEIKKDLLNWYDFKPGSRALYIGEENPYASVLNEAGLSVVCAPIGLTDSPLWQQEREGSFDYIVAVGILETWQEPGELLKAWRRLLKPDGTLLLGMNSRFGLKYFCGDRGPSTERSFDGIEGYRRVYVKRENTFMGRCCSREEIKELLGAAGWKKVRLFPTYHYSSSVFVEEECLYDGLIKNGMFHQMANAYLAECPADGSVCDVSHVTSSMERGRENALVTIIRRSGTVEKRAPYEEGRKRLLKLLDHGRDLAAHGIGVIDARMEKEFLEQHGAEMVFFPYTEGTSSTKIKALIEKKLS